MKKLNYLLFAALCNFYCSYGMMQADPSTALLLSIQKQQQAYADPSKKKSPINISEKKDLDAIFNVQAQNYCNTTFPSLRLSQIQDSYLSLSRSCRKNVVKNMSDAALITHCIALSLPEEIKNKILSYLVENNNKLLEIFKTKPFLQTWRLYTMIKRDIKNPDVPIEPLCDMDLSDVKLILKLMQHNNNTPLIVNNEERKRIETFNQDIKDLYLQKSSAIFLRDNMSGCYFGLPTIAMILGKGIGGLTLVIGSCCGYSVCNTSFVVPVILVPSIACTCAACVAITATKACCPSCIPTEKIFVL